MAENIEPRRRGNLQREKNGLWTMRVMVGGRRYSRATETGDIDQAETALTFFVEEMERDHLVEPDCGPFDKFWTTYLVSSEAARLTPIVLKSRRAALRHFSLWMRDCHPEVADAAGVTRQIADEYIAAYGVGRAAFSFNMRATSLKSIFRVMLDGVKDAENPWDAIKMRIIDGHSRRELSHEEVRRIIAAADAFGAEWRVLIALGIYTGLRLGDCCLLSWENVNIVTGLIHVVPQKTRRYSHGRSVTIPIHEQLLSALVKSGDAMRSGFVMPGIAALYSKRRGRFTRKLKKVFENAGIVRNAKCEGRTRAVPLATFHSLRHTFVSLAANAGVPIVVVQAIVGHASPVMTQHYYHANAVALKRAVDAIPSFSSDGICASSENKYMDPALAFDFKCPPPPKLSLRRRLDRVSRLFKDGLIGHDEFAALRKRILIDA